MFFDEYPAFLTTSETANELTRLNLRHEAIIADNADVLAGARVLDLASHDGRWSFAALKSGAAHVTGIEAREHLVTTSRETFAEHGVPADAYEFVHGEVFDVFSRGAPQADVVLCLGFLYHTLRYPELFSGIRATGARYLILDTEIAFGRTQPVILIDSENTRDDARAAPDEFSYGDRCLIGRPSLSALDAILKVYDYRVERSFDWPGFIAEHPDAMKVQGYATGRRITVRAVDAPAPPKQPTAKVSAVRRMARAAGVRRPPILRKR